ncbi:MAG TPA: MFS transporter [Polyangia bacterium]|nr:MFS transporter [Polyangia bacterium]
MTRLAGAATITAAVNVFARPRVLILFPLGFAAGLPYMLVSSTLSAWLTNTGVSLAGVGLFSAVTLPYSLKLLWAPFVDRYRPPLLGRRRGWIVLFQLALGGALVALGATSPRAAPLAFAALAIGVTLCAASQDIAADAYRTDLLAPDERAAGTAVYVFGYRAAMLVTVGLALVVADHLPFGRIYQLSAVLLAVGVVAAVIAPEPSAVAPPVSLRAAVVEPLTDWLTRPRALALIAFVAVYRLSDLVAAAMSTPFLIALGFSNTEIGLVNKNIGIAATIAGALAGGAIVARAGLRRPLVAFGVAVPVSNLLWAALAVTGKSRALLLVAVAAHDALVGCGIAALAALILTSCNRRYGATQYALLSAAAGLAGRIATAPSGAIAARLGWPTFFAAGAAAGIVALALTAPTALRAIDTQTDSPRTT